EAEQVAREARQVAEEANLGDAPQSSFVHTALGRALAARGQLFEAAAELERALQLRRPAPGISQWGAGQHLLIHGPIRLALGDRQGAEALLAEARAIVEADPDTGHLRRQLDHLQAELRRPPRRWLLRGDALTEAEVAVLELLPSPLSRREIAGQLYL